MANRTEELLRKFLSQTANYEEQQELFSLLNELSDEALSTMVGNNWDRVRETHILSPEAQHRVLKTILVQPRRRWSIVYAAAAAAILMVVVAGYYFLSPRRLSKSDPVLSATQDITPAANQAVLKLANGKTILLDAQANGLIGNQSNISIYKDTDGTVRYQSQQTAKNLSVIYDTLTTPGGGIYNIILADGTRVWLNAASSLRFPEGFNGGVRKVELIYGEAYFEVIHNATMPFTVTTPGGKVNDLGTHFNIYAYKGDAEQTTLIEGSVAVQGAGKPVILKPGQQSEIRGSLLQVNEVDVTDVIAWKNGLFVFNRVPLSNVMQELSRWYNVQVQYIDAAAKEEVLIASVSRYKNILEVLDLLESAGKVKFELKGNIVSVKIK